MISQLAISLDIYLDNGTYTAKQSDAGSRYLLISITDNGTATEIESNAVVNLKARKPSGAVSYDHGTVTDGKALILLTSDTLAEAGMVYCELEITQIDPVALLKTLTFKLDVKSEVYSQTIPESTSTFTALTEALAAAGSIGKVSDLKTEDKSTLVAGVNEIHDEVVDLQNDKEDKSNKVTSIDSESTDTQYPSAKLTYDQLALKEPNLPVTPLLPTEKFLNGNKEWAVPAHNKLTDLNTDAEYQHMSSDEKTKLTNIEGGAEVNIIETISIDTADLPPDVNRNVNIPLATALIDGAMSSEYAGKLDGVAENANNYSHPNHSGDVLSTGDGATVIDNNKVTNAKLAQMNTKTIKGNDTAGTANAKDLTVAETKALLDIDDLEMAVTELQADVNTLELTNLAYDKTIYGFYWDKTTNTFSRTMSARGAIVNIGVDSEVVYNEFDLSTLFRDIEEVTDSLGNVFVRFPKMYFKKTDTATYYSVEVSRVEFKGSYLPQCFWDFTNEVELDYVDIGKHIASLSDDTTKLESKPGKYPLINKNIVQMRTLAQANGAGYQQLDIHAVDYLQTLFTIEQATVDSQSKLFGYANGRYTATDLAVITESDTYRVVLSNAAAAPYEVGQSISIGTTQGGNQIFYGRTILSITEYDVDNKVLTFSGDPVTITAGNMVYNTSYKTGFSSGIASSVGSLVSNFSGKHPFAWHGIESLYGDIWQFVDGLNINDNQSWVCRDADDYASNLFAAPYEKLSYINATSNNYVLTRGFDRAHPYAQLPTAVGAIGDSQYKDYYYQATGQRIARVGGHWYSGSLAGLFCWSLNYSSAVTDLHFGGRLLKKAL